MNQKNDRKALSDKDLNEVTRHKGSSPASDTNNA